MDIISAYQQLGSYRAAADLCGTTHKTVKRVVDKFEADQAGDARPPRVERAHNYDAVAELVAERVAKSQGRISAKRLLPIAAADSSNASTPTSVRHRPDDTPTAPSTRRRCLRRNHFRRTTSDLR
jgi:hypothetical protein